MLLKKASFLVLVLWLLFFAAPKIRADSDYVLPYPGIMPGHRLYPVKQLADRLYRYWAFGSFSGHRYELGLADKKLVEAKTLFEYRQYFLAVQALAESDEHFKNAAACLNKAAGQGKDVSKKNENFRAAAEKHRQVLENLIEVLPPKLVWQPEKQTAIDLDLGSVLKEAIKIREI